MADLNIILPLLAERLGTIPGLTAWAELPDSFVAPGAFFVDLGSRHELTFGSSETYDLSELNVELVVAVSKAGGLTNARRILQPYTANTGAASIRATLAADRTLGGAIIGLAFPETWSRAQDEEINDGDYLGQRLTIRGWAT